MPYDDWKQIEKKFVADGWELREVTENAVVFSSNASLTTFASTQAASIPSSALFPPTACVDDFSDQETLFVDDFSDQETLSNNWCRRTGGPSIDPSVGLPPPALKLAVISNQQGQPANSFVLLKNLGREKGVIECDFYLEPGALFNIVVYCDDQNDNWYMARFDARSVYSDGILIKDQGPGVDWRPYEMAKTQTKSEVWLRARVEFSPETIKMYKNGQVVAEARVHQIFGKKLGIFNECANVWVDNFQLF